MAADDRCLKVLESIVQLFNEDRFNSVKEMLKYSKLAADNGNEGSMFRVVKILREAEHYRIRRNDTNCVKYARILAEREHKEGMYLYADLILGDSVDDDKELDDDDEYLYNAETNEKQEVVQFCKESADMGNMDAIALYGECLLYGINCDKDIDKDLRYILKSSEDKYDFSDKSCLIYSLNADLSKKILKKQLKTSKKQKIPTKKLFTSTSD